MDKEILEKIDVKLGVLIALQIGKEKPETNREKIQLLSDLGLRYTEIASILNVPSKYISKEISLIKKRGKKNEKKK